jgi:hypothetical protein
MFPIIMASRFENLFKKAWLVLLSLLRLNLLTSQASHVFLIRINSSCA